MSYHEEARDAFRRGDTAPVEYETAEQPGRLTGDLPRPVEVRATGCARIVDAFERIPSRRGDGAA